MSSDYPTLVSTKLAVMKLVLRYHENPKAFLTDWHLPEKRRALLEDVAPDEDTLVALIEEDIAALLIDQVNTDADAAQLFEGLKKPVGPRYTGHPLFVKGMTPTTVRVGEEVTLTARILLDSNLEITKVSVGIPPQRKGDTGLYLKISTPNGLQPRGRDLEIRTTAVKAGSYTVAVTGKLKTNDQVFTDFLPAAFQAVDPEKK